MKLRSIHKMGVRYEKDKETDTEIQEPQASEFDDTILAYVQ